jgi:hypothetical protein
VVPASLRAVSVSGNSLILGGTGPANGRYALLAAAKADGPFIPLMTNQFGVSGQFLITNLLPVGGSGQYFRLRIP